MILAAAIACAAVAIAACGDGDADAARSAVPAAKVDRFSASRAMADVRRQVGHGPRPAGSAALRRLAVHLRARLPRGRFEAVPGHRGLRNVVGRIPGRRPAIVIGAHYDTKAIPGFVGAEDGASGTAMVLELSRILRRAKAPAGAREVRFVLFDGEEATDDRDFYGTGLRGSRAYVARHRDEVHSLVLLDFVGQRDIRIPREAGSDVRLWAWLRAAARRVGTLSVFPAREVAAIADDHVPFTQAGIPAIDVIDFDYPYWHTPEDTLDKLSARSLDAVGETVAELVLRLRRG